MLRCYQESFFWIHPLKTISFEIFSNLHNFLTSSCSHVGFHINTFSNSRREIVLEATREAKAVHSCTL